MDKVFRIFRKNKHKGDTDKAEDDKMKRTLEEASIEEEPRPKQRQEEGGEQHVSGADDITPPFSGGAQAKSKMRKHASSVSSSSSSSSEDDFGDDEIVDIADDQGLFVDLKKEREELVRSKFEVLCQVPFFAQFKKEHQIQLFEELRVEHYRDGDLIVKQGDHGDRMYILIEGEAVVWRKEQGDDTKDITHLYQHDYFGELALVYGQERNSNVSAIGNTTVMYLAKDGFEKFENIRVFMIVQKIPLLSKLNPDMQVKIVQKLTAVSFEKGEYVVKQGDKGDAFFMISKGSAAVVENDEVSTNLYEGHTFGQMALLSGAPRLASVKATESLICMKLMAKDFQALIAENSDFNKLLTSDDQVIRRRRSKRDARKKGTRAYGVSVDSGGAARRFSTESGFYSIDNNSSAALIDNKIAKTSRGGHRVVNGFVLKEEIGRGTFGRVKLCIREDTGKKFAIKIVDKSKIGNKFSIHAPGLHEMRQEVAIMKKLRHPNIVNLVAVIDDPKAENLYIVTEYCENGAIMSELEENSPLSEQVAREYFRDVLLGLQYLHLEGVIHRDIKPMNLLLTRDNVVKIADFGAARMIVGDKKWISGVTGTPAFMAPELLVEDRDVYDGPAVDLWSCGATLFMFVTGSPPWMSDDEIKLSKKVKNDELLFPADWNKKNYSPHLKNLISQLLVKDPKQRLTLKATMMHEWVTEEGSEILPYIETPEGKVLGRWESSGGAATNACPTQEEEDAAVEQLEPRASNQTLIDIGSNDSLPISSTRKKVTSQQTLDELIDADPDIQVLESDFNSDDESDNNQYDIGRSTFKKAIQKQTYEQFVEEEEDEFNNNNVVELQSVDVSAAKKGGKKCSTFNVRYGFAQDQNKRAKQEDTVSICDKLSTKGGKSWFSSSSSSSTTSSSKATSSSSSEYFYAAVFDGHGGELVSALLKETLHGVIQAQPTFTTNLTKAVEDGCLEMDRRMLHRAANYLNTHRQKVSAGTARQSLIRTKGNDRGKQSEKEEYQKAGSTALMMFISCDKQSKAKNRMMTIAWVGDSRAVLSRAGVAVELSEDHKANRPDESKRIRDAGGTVDRKGRVDGALAVSRAFGDIQHKGFELEELTKMKPSGESGEDDKKLRNGFVIALPDIEVRSIEPKDEFVILASDGLWDVMSNQAAVNFCRTQLATHHNVQTAAENLCRKAVERSVDNVSVVVVSLHC